MGMLSWLFRRRYRCPGCGFDLNKMHVVSSCILKYQGRHLPCPMCGTQVPNRMKIHDFRPESEKEIERQAQSPLGNEDEDVAKRVFTLQQQRGDTAAKAEIRKVGEHLGANGGHERMARVAYRVEYLGGSSRQLEYDWSGICGWKP